MFKKLATFLFTIIACLNTFSQEKNNLSENAIGLKVSVTSFSREISYQRLLSETNRLDINLSFSKINKNTFVNINSSYQWFWNINKNFYWYTGIGGGLASTNNNEGNSNVYASIHGLLGIEQHLQMPLQFFIECKPEIFLGSNSFFPNINAGIRYKF